MANLKNLLNFGRGAVERSLEIDQRERETMEKRRKSQMAFAMANYKSDLSRYNALMLTKDKMALTGSTGGGGKESAYDKALSKEIVKSYVNKSTHPEMLQQKIEGRLKADPSLAGKMLGAFDRVSKPQMKDYIDPNKAASLSEKRIGDDNYINQLFFGSKRGNRLKTYKKLKLEEEEAMRIKPGKDFTGNLHSEMSRIRSESGAGTEKYAKQIQGDEFLSKPIMMVHKSGDKRGGIAKGHKIVATSKRGFGLWVRDGYEEMSGDEWSDYKISWYDTTDDAGNTVQKPIVTRVNKQTGDTNFKDTGVKLHKKTKGSVPNTRNMYNSLTAAVKSIQDELKDGPQGDAAKFYLNSAANFKALADSMATTLEVAPGENLDDAIRANLRDRIRVKHQEMQEAKNPTPAGIPSGYVDTGRKSGGKKVWKDPATGKMWIEQ